MTNNHLNTLSLGIMVRGADFTYVKSLSGRSDTVTCQNNEASRERQSNPKIGRLFSCCAPHDEVAVAPILKAGKPVGYAFDTSDFVGTTGYCDCGTPMEPQSAAHVR